MRRLILSLIAIALFAPVVVGQEAPPAPPDIYIKENDSLVITVPNLSRVAVGDPSVVNATIVSPHEVLLQGRPISLTSSSRAALRTFQEVAATLAAAAGETGAAVPSAGGAEEAPAFFAVSNVYVWSGDQRYIYRVVVVNTADERARPPFLEGYRIDVVPDRLILSGISESEERRAAGERILTAQGFRVENKITVLDRPLIGTITRPSRDLVYLAIQHNLLLQGMTREEAEAAIGSGPIGPPRFVKEGSVTFEEYEYKPYTVRYYEDRIVSFRRHVDFDEARTAGEPAEVAQAGGESYRLYNLRYVTVGAIESIFDAVIPTFTPSNPNARTVVIRAPEASLQTLDKLVAQADQPEFGSRISVARAPAPPPTVQGGGGTTIDEGPRDIALIRLTGVTPAEQERIVDELQDLAARIKVRRVNSGAAGVGGAGTGVAVDFEETALNLQAIRDTLIIIEAPGIIDVLLSYLSGRIERMGIEDVDVAVRSGRPVRGMTLEQLNAALGRTPAGSPTPIRQPDGSIIWEYDYGDRIARFQDGRLIDNAPPKDRRVPPQATLERLVSLGQIAEGMTQAQVERAIGGETPTRVSLDVDFDGSEIWEYTYPSYFVRYRNGVVLDYTPQAAAKDTTVAQVTRFFAPKSRTAVDLLSIVGSFLTVGDTAAGTASGRILIDSPTNSLIVSDYPDVMEKIEEYIRLLDEQTQYQVLVEARFVEMRRGAIRRLGVRWNVQGRNPQGNAPFITVNEGSTDVSTPGGSNQGTAGISIGVLDANSFRFGHIALQDIDVLVDALEQENLGKVLQAPRVLTVQNRPATLKAIDRVYDITVTTTTSTGTSTTTSTSTTATPKDVGVTLTVTPTIGRDGIITLNLKPTVSEVTDQLTSSDGLAAGNIINVLAERSYDATVQVRSGTTLVIGGLVRQRNIDNSDKVPFLHRVPILGRIFRSDNATQEENDLVIFLNAQIVATDGGRIPTEIEGAEPPVPPYETISGPATPSAAGN